MFHDTSKSAIADVAQLGLTRTQDEHEVESFWRGLKLDRYISGFSENGFDRMDVVMDMKVIHMREIGVAAGHILKLQKGLSVLQHAAPKGSLRSRHRGPAKHCLHTEHACEQAVAKELFCNTDAIKSSLGEDPSLTPEDLHVAKRLQECCHFLCLILLLSLRCLCGSFMWHGGSLYTAPEPVAAFVSRSRLQPACPDRSFCQRL